MEGLVASQESVLQRRGGERQSGRRLGERPREIAGGRQGRGSGQAVAGHRRLAWEGGLGCSCSWVHRCGAQGEKWGKEGGGPIILPRCTCSGRGGGSELQTIYLIPWNVLASLCSLGPLCFTNSFMGTCVVINTCRVGPGPCV